MFMIDLGFPAHGDTLPTDHAYPLYSALTKAAPWLHEAKAPFMLASIPGLYVGNGLLQLQPKRSRLWFRIAPERIATFLPLAGQTLDLAGHAIRLGVPQVHALVPAPALVARAVTIKGFTEPGPFLQASRRQLDALGVAGEIGIRQVEQGQREGEPRRRIIRIKGKRVIGFNVQVVGLNAQESIRLQEAGLGGRRHLTCGFFVPLRPRLP